MTEKARQIFGSYRRDDFAEPEVFLRNLSLVLERYDDKVIEVVTSPLTGIQRTCKFPPSIAEVVEFIEAHIRRSSYAANWNAQAAKQLRERAELEAQEKAEPLEHRQKVAARIKDELREHSFAFKDDTKPAKQTWRKFSDDELIAIYGKRKTSSDTP